jgi:hypothetical protein
MKLDAIAQSLNLVLLTTPKDLGAINAATGYTSDMLSCVMSGASRGSIWVTLQAHVNVVAVAALLELAAIIITENAAPDPATIAKANEKDVILFSTPLASFEVVGKLGKWDPGEMTRIFVSSINATFIERVD